MHLPHLLSDQHQADAMAVATLTQALALKTDRLAASGMFYPRV